MKQVMVTCYDATFAKLCAESQAIDFLLVGDSAGMVLQGAETTHVVTLEEMMLYTRSVARGVASAQVEKKPQIVSDLPIGTYQDSAMAFASSQKLIQSGAQIVKLEGPCLEVIETLVKHKIRVCGHIGLTPQTIRDYKVQGRTSAEAKRLKDEALAIQEAGAEMIVLEMIPSALAAEITESLRIPTIGIGAGAATNGQVLVLYDLLGLNPTFNPKFLKKYSDGYSFVANALKDFAHDVTTGQYPNEEHSFR